MLSLGVVIKTNLPYPMLTSHHAAARHNHLSEDEYFENAPYIYASGGVGGIPERARAKISEAVIEKYGGYDRFPLSLYTPFADNGNVLEPDELAERHYICGDPPFVRAEWSVP